MSEINSNGQINGGAAEIVNLLNDVRTRSSKEGKYFINVKYGHYSILVANSDGCWVLSVRDENVQEVIPEDPNIWSFLWGKTRPKDITGGDYGFYLGRKWCGSLVERAAVEAIRIINEYEDNLEWENLLVEGEFITEQTVILENTIDENVEKAKAAMDDAKQLIDGMNDVDWWDRDDDELKKCITNYCGDIAEALIGIAQARQNFLKNCSDFTGCDFTLGDAYSDCPVIAFNHYYDELDQFDCTLAFEQILDEIFENVSDEMLDLRDTLFHYLMVA